MGLKERKRSSGVGSPPSRRTAAPSGHEMTGSGRARRHARSRSHGAVRKRVALKFAAICVRCAPAVSCPGVEREEVFVEAQKSPPRGGKNVALPGYALGVVLA